METMLALILGVALSAACGFRVFVPPLIVSLAAMSGHLQLAKGFAWMGTPEALLVFSVATLLEIGAYYVPWVDNLLDTVAGPAAVVAGTVLTASVLTDMSPMLRWTLALVAGGTAAGFVQGSTTLVRGLSTALTGGVANPLLATAELGAATVASGVSVLLSPVLALAVVAGVLMLGVVGYRTSRRPTSAEPPRLHLQR